jgi:UDP-N-acetylmuramoyl-L-alanyl-D-glutamate--2,6-diaminopimelate ligase
MKSVREIARQIGARITGPEGDPVPASGEQAVTNDSRCVVAGGLFVAIRGARVNGNDFVGAACERGALGIVSEEPSPVGFEGYWLEVDDARVALARLANLIYDQPSTRLALVGVTGTNGKTTTTWLVESVLRAAGLSTATMGTISYRIGDTEMAADFTTPEAPAIHYFLQQAVRAGVTHAVMEVSSIALELHRADGLHFAVAAFTNLTQDHLDFHQTMEAYFAAKRKLFDGSIGHYPLNAVINIDDPSGRQLADEWRARGGEPWSYGLDGGAVITIAGRRGAASTPFGLDGLRFTALTPAGEIEVDSPLVGRPHASNILGTIGIGLALGLEPELIATGIRQCHGVPGRFERVSTPDDDITVIIDYAHTPDALANVLRTINTARSGTRHPGSLTTVFGCGGDRDRSKRPLMGEEAGRMSETVILTSDNPRREDPLLILNDIRVGIDRVGRKNYKLITDRREAIYEAVTTAKPGDVVLVAGKGHETYQILASGKISFDDREVARDALRERRECPGLMPTGRN